MVFQLQFGNDFEFIVFVWDKRGCRSCFLLNIFQLLIILPAYAFWPEKVHKIAWTEAWEADGAKEMIEKQDINTQLIISPD